MKCGLSKLNRHLKVCILVLLSVLLLVATPQTVKADYNQGYYYFTVSNSKATITNYYNPSGMEEALVIPSTLGGYPVVAIGNGAFATRDLASVTIPDSVTSIGDYAFWECSLLATVNIPSSVTSIGNSAFYPCIELRAINVDSANPTYKSIDGVLFNKAGTILIQYPGMKSDTSYVIPNTVTTIGNNAFAYCFILTSITLPSSVTSIGEHAFDSCFVPSITIPNSVTTIGNYAFYGSYLTSITLGNSVISIGDYAFSWCEVLTSITFLGLAPPTTGIAWISSTPSTLLGHAYYVSSFPAPGEFFNGLKMGEYIPEYDYYYTIVNGQATIASYRGTDTDVIIPDTLGGCPVVAIGDNAFAGQTSITTIAISSSVTIIGESAFSGCASLTSITFFGLTQPTTVGTNWITGTPSTLLGHAYYGSNFPIPNNLFYGLKMGANIPEDYYYTIADGKATIKSYHGASLEVNIPDTLGGCPVVAIGRYAFGNQRDLTSVTIPNSVIVIGNNSFADCISLKSVTIPNSVTNINAYAFQNCRSLTSVTIPDSVISIGPNAFYWCTSLISISLGSSVADFSYRVLSWCPALTQINVDTENPNYKSIDGVVFDKQGTALIQYPMGKQDTTYTIPNTVNTIGSNALKACDYLISVTIPDSVTSIGGYAFLDCSALASVTIPGSVRTIDYGAFVQCTSMASVTISSGVTSIGREAFSGCEALTTLVIPDSVTSIGNGAFTNCHALTSVTLPNGITTIGGSTFSWCYVLSSITIPDGVTSIGSGAFYQCYALTTITIPDGVTSIGNSAFAWCTSLASVTIPDSVTSIASSAFTYCRSLHSVTIPDSVTSIGHMTFYRCDSLTSITIGSGVTSIGNEVFHSCTSLTNINFLGLTPPTTGTDWIYGTNPALLGHAYFGSSFPAPGNAFNGLMMSQYLPDTAAPTISSVVPSSPITLYTKGTTASQTFSASYTDNVAVASATITLNGVDVSSTWGVSTSGFSYSAALPIGTNTIVLSVKDTADSQEQKRTSSQTWSVTVVKDTTAPTISGIPTQKIPVGTTITVTVTDSQSGVNWNSFKVYIDNKDVMSKITLGENTFSIPASLLSKGPHSLKFTISDYVGNIAAPKYDIMVK